MITGRTSYMLSAFGEHLTGELVETCVLAAAESDRRPGAASSPSAPSSPKAGGDLGHHAYVVEFDPQVADADRVTRFAAADRSRARPAATRTMRSGG